MPNPERGRPIPARPTVEHKRPKDSPYSQGDAIIPFYVSDAYLWHLTMQAGEGDNQRTDLKGIQLVCYFYVPTGYTGFIKQIRIAPYLPEQFDIRYMGINRDFGAEPDAPNPYDGIYTTPAGWEGLLNAGGEPPHYNIPIWRWHLRAISGNQGPRIKQASDNFDVTDPNTWKWCSPWPVPAIAYPGGAIPGRTLGNIGPQKIQRTGQYEEGDLHIVVPEDTTITLWATWEQQEIQPEFASWLLCQIALGAPPPPPPPPPWPVVYPCGREPIVPINPSFGSMVGYIQANHACITSEHAKDGW